MKSTFKKQPLRFTEYPLLSDYITLSFEARGLAINQAIFHVIMYLAYVVLIVIASLIFFSPFLRMCINWCSSRNNQVFVDDSNV